jgi:hypothetical protein
MLASPQTSQPQILRSEHIPTESRIVGCLDTQQGDFPFCVQGDGWSGAMSFHGNYCQDAFENSVLAGRYIE